jgi:hypothetical protein
VGESPSSSSQGLSFDEPIGESCVPFDFP